MDSGKSLDHFGLLESGIGSAPAYLPEVHRVVRETGGEGVRLVGEVMDLDWEGGGTGLVHYYYY